MKYAADTEQWDQYIETPITSLPSAAARPHDAFLRVRAATLLRRRVAIAMRRLGENPSSPE
jgi:hypothetical protein